jgi:Raf kinase inhibitor-like YbhB/YbcL family protein
MKLTSNSFVSGEIMPVQFTCDGTNIPPHLHWDEIPAGTQSFVLIVDDPDAPGGTWDHWLLYNIPAEVHTLPEAIQEPPLGSQVGKNSWRKMEYGGPCPPSGQHRYFFRVYALDTKLELEDGVTKDILQQEMRGHILAEAEIMAKYR